MNNLENENEQSLNNDDIQEIQLRTAEIGQGTIIKRALPSRKKRMIGAWCFLDHAGPVDFMAGDGLDVGPHPHIGLQTFTWMIEGTILHTDSLGHKQLIRPKQVNLMTAGQGISHTEVAPDTETKMHTAQLWIALPDEKRHMLPKFEHYPTLPSVEENGIVTTVLVGEFADLCSPVQVYTPLIGLDLEAKQSGEIVVPLNPKFEYAMLVLNQTATIEGHLLTDDNMLVLDLGQTACTIQMQQGSRLLIIGGEPFESEILLWWNLVARTQEEIVEARQQWLEHDKRFGDIPDYKGKRLEAPELSGKMRASK